jgi:hypothetical protein
VGEDLGTARGKWCVILWERWEKMGWESVGRRGRRGLCVGYRIEDIKGAGERRMSGAGGSGKSEYELAVHEEMMDSIMKGVCEKSRWDLWTETLKIGREYRSQVGKLRDSEMEGDILIGIRMLSDYWRQKFGTFERKEDTYYYCLTLHLWAGLLACDRINDPKWPSKDDRFKGIYERNYEFRRDWVAFLSRMVAYVESMYVSETDGDFKLYLKPERLSQMHDLYRAGWWKGYDWAAVKGHIQTAQDKINKEPPTVWQRMRKWTGSEGAGMEDGDDVGEMLARLRELSV